VICAKALFQPFGICLIQQTRSNSCLGNTQFPASRRGFTDPECAFSAITPAQTPIATAHSLQHACISHPSRCACDRFSNPSFSSTRSTCL
jgi:hypothetical protein